MTHIYADTCWIQEGDEVGDKHRFFSSQQVQARKSYKSVGDLEFKVFLDDTLSKLFPDMLPLHSSCVNLLQLFVSSSTMGLVAPCDQVSLKTNSAKKKTVNAKMLPTLACLMPWIGPRSPPAADDGGGPSEADGGGPVFTLIPGSCK